MWSQSKPVQAILFFSFLFAYFYLPFFSFLFSLFYSLFFLFLIWCYSFLPLLLSFLLCFNYSFHLSSSLSGDEVLLYLMSDWWRSEHSLTAPPLLYPSFYCSLSPFCPAVYIFLFISLCILLSLPAMLRLFFHLLLSVFVFFCPFFVLFFFLWSVTLFLLSADLVLPFI